LPHNTIYYDGLIPSSTGMKRDRLTIEIRSLYKIADSSAGAVLRHGVGKAKVVLILYMFM
jgi:hypothetical protein